MTEEEAISIADQHVREQGGQLTPRVGAWRKKRWFRGKYYWRVVSNMPRKGGNWFIEIDELDGKILDAHYTKK